jgi:hypothetical protein
MTRSSLVFALATALTTLAPAAFADTIIYKADLTAASEVPPNDSKGTGTIEATYDTASKMLTWKGSYKDLTGPASAAHFHGPAALGKNAPPMVPVDASKSPFEGNATLTDDQAKAFADGLIYFNVHTKANGGGEIRGQLAAAK